MPRPRFDFTSNSVEVMVNLLHLADWNTLYIRVQPVDEIRDIHSGLAILGKIADDKINDKPTHRELGNRNTVRSASNSHRPKSDLTIPLPFATDNRSRSHLDVVLRSYLQKQIHHEQHRIREGDPSPIHLARWVVPYITPITPIDGACPFVD